MRIAIVEDQELMAEALERLCTTELGCKVVARATTGIEAIKVILATRPEVVLLDLGLPGIDGFRVMEVARQAGCRSRVLVLSANCDEHTVYRVEKAEFDGFVDKSSGALRTVRIALRAIENGRSYYSGRYLRLRSERIRDPHSFDKVLTDREQTVLSLVGSIRTDDEIAEKLRMSRATAEKHRFNILHKLGLRSKVALLRYALDHGFRPLAGESRRGRKRATGAA